MREVGESEAGTPQNRPRSRGNGEGTIYRRKSDQRWVASYFDDRGKRRVLYGSNRRDVAQKLADALRARKRGELAAARCPTLNEFAPWWLEHEAKGRVRPAALARYEQFWRLQVQPHLGSTRLDRISPADLTELYRTLQRGGGAAARKPLAANTIMHVHNFLHTLVDGAVRAEHVGHNVVDRVSAPKVEAYEFRSFTPEEAKRFVEAVIGDWLEAMYLMAVCNGIREGELRALKWGDLTLTGETWSVQIRRSVSRVTGVGLVEGSTKSRSGRRNLSLARGVVAALERHRTRQALAKEAAGDSWIEAGYVFTGPNGRPIEPTELLRKNFYPLLERLGLPRIRFHDLRHSFATLMLALRTHPGVLQELMGHSTIRLTYDTYTHAIPAANNQANLDLGEFLFGGGDLADDHPMIDPEIGPR